MAVGTKNVNAEEGPKFVPKNLTPGNYACVMHSIIMKKAEYVKERDEYQIILNLEGPPLGDKFEGFFIDNNDQSKGRYKGQSAMVRLSQYNYRDGETQNHYPINRDEEILKDLKRLCTELGCLEWFDNADGKFETVELFVEALNREQPFAGVSMNYCIAGKEYLNKKGYKAYELFLPRKTQLGRPYCKDAEKVQKFFESEHVKKNKPKELNEGFESNSNGENKNSEPNITNAVIISETKTAETKDELPFSLD